MTFLVNRSIPERVAERALTRVYRVPSTGCLISSYSRGSHGYAQIGWSDSAGKKFMVPAHRASWVAANGPIPDGMTIDHLCRVRACVNPDHLRLLPNEVNAADNRGVVVSNHDPKEQRRRKALASAARARKARS